MIGVPLKFKGRVVSESLRQSQIPELLDLPVRNGNTDPNSEYGVEMTTPNGKKAMVYTCREWKKALGNKWYSATTYDIAMEGFFIQTCGLLFEFTTGQAGTEELYFESSRWTCRPQFAACGNA